MTGDYYTDAELIAYIDANAEAVDVEAARKHVELDACDDCLPRLEEARRFFALLRDRTIHNFATPAAMRPRPSPGHLIGALHLASRRNQEDLAAEVTLQSLTRSPMEEWLANLPPDAPSGGLVRVLIREARAAYDQSPRHALRLLDVAESVASRLEAREDIIEQRGLIAKTRAEALRMLGQHPAALAALDSAESLLSQLPAPAYDLAFVDWVRAGVLFWMTRYAEALLVARKAIRMFREHGDIDGVQRVRMIEATILCEQGEVETAHRMFTRLALFFGRRGDAEMVARLNANLAECEVRLDRRDVAHEYAADAMRMYDQLGYKTEKVRVRWILGHALMRAGDTEEALQELRGAADAFDALGMTAEVAVVGLDLAELHLSQGNWKEAEALARDLTHRFTGAGAPVPVHRAHAFACLQAAVAAPSAPANSAP